MVQKYLLGNEAIAYGCLEAPVDVVCGYPGTPSSEVIDFLRFSDSKTCYVEWSVNEKVAFEETLAASWCGLRSLVTMKHVGLNVAADPLMTSAYTGITGGFVILAADDPYAHSSQNEQDSRCYAHFARIPCLDPATVQEAHDMCRDAFALSEETGLPVLFRPTTRICHSKSDVTIGEFEESKRVGHFEKNPAQYVVIPAHTRVLHKKLNEKQPGIKKRLVELGYNWYTVQGKTAVIAGGIAASYVRELLPPGISFAKIGAYPIDEAWLSDFVRKHDSILVIEELAPVIEEVVRQAACGQKVQGKMSGDVPYEGELSPDKVRSYMQGAGIQMPPVFSPPVGTPALPFRPPILCAGCMHRAAMYAMKKVFKNGIFPSDIGCYTLGIQQGTVDTTICMGASITVGSGMSISGEDRDIICTIGDSTFLHTGIQGLINAVYNGADIIVIILDNRITAMTGHQPNPTTGITATGIETPPLSLETLCRACGVQYVETAPLSLETLCRACGVQYVETASPNDYPQFVDVLRKAQKRHGVRVVIAKQPCVISEKREKIKRKRYSVDTGVCIGCKICVQYGCPAIELSAGYAVITDLCSGCGVCSQLCPSGAIGPEERI